MPTRSYNEPPEPLDPLDVGATEDAPEWENDPCERCESRTGCGCRSCSNCDAVCLRSEFCSTCRDCDECCRCFNCGGCDREQPGYDRCDICENCSNCCHCSYCGRCGRTSRAVCQGCDRCNADNCGCICEQNAARRAAEAARVRTRELEIREIFYQCDLKFHEGKPNKLNPSKRYLAAEIEVAEMPTNRRGVLDVVKKWHAQIVPDGSIHAGFEVNTAPASGDQFIKQIDEICEQIDKGGGKITTACGLHLHADARDFTYYDLRRLILLYAKIESALYRIVAPSRRDNHYCVPCGNKFRQAVKASAMPKEFKKNIFRSVYGKSPTLTLNKKQGDPHTKYARNSNSTRYSALNIHSWFYRGTIECRMHHGTITPKAIRSWGVLWARLLDVALTLSEKQIEALPDDGLTALLQVTDKMPETHTWIINRALFFAKKDGYTGNMLVPCSGLTCNQLRAMRKPDQTLDDTKEDNQ